MSACKSPKAAKSAKPQLDKARVRALLKIYSRLSDLSIEISHKGQEWDEEIVALCDMIEDVGGWDMTRQLERLTPIPKRD